MLLVLGPASAEAYLDPGTGSYVFQMVLAAAISLGFVLKTYWRRVVDAIARWRSRRGPQD